MRCLPQWITRLRARGLMLSGAMLVTFGCTESGGGPGVSAPPSTPASPTESFVDKKPKEVQDGTAPKKRGNKSVGTDAAKGVAPAGAQ